MQSSTSTSEFPGLSLDHNIAINCGRLSSAPVRRELPSGDVVHNYEVTVRDTDAGTESVPVARFTNGRVPKLQEGDDVLVTGRVRRRFFQAHGTTASRTEVVATAVLPASQLDRANKAVDRLLRPLFDEP